MRFKAPYIIVLLTIISCTRHNKITNEQKIIEKWFDKELVLPLIDEVPGQRKIVSVVDGLCNPCVSTLSSWEKYLDEFHQQDTTLKIIIYMSYVDSSMFDEIFNINQNLCKYLVFDKNNDFMNINKLTNNPRFTTFLVDQDNKVKLIGSPVQNETLKNLYLEQIKTLKENVSD